MTDKQPESKALTIKEETVDLILSKITRFQENGELDLPANYSPANALKSAWLILQSTVDKDKRPVLAVCSKNSIANAMLDMVLQGLNPAKKQCYFIAYGQNLTLQRSYFGTMAVLRQVRPEVGDIVSEIVYEGDTFKYKLVRGRREVTDHEQTLENVDNKKIRAAYCVIYDRDDKPIRTEIMTITEIMQAWKQSRQNPFDENGNVKGTSVHGKFTADMAKKTVTNRACKTLINSSDDSNLTVQAIRRSDDERHEAEVEREISENANQGEVIDVEPEVVPEPEQAAPVNGGSSPPPPPQEPKQQTMQRGPDF